MIKHSIRVASWLFLILPAAEATATAAAAAAEGLNTNNDEAKQWLHDNKTPQSSSSMIHYKYEPEDAFIPSGNECVSELYEIQQAEERLSIKDILLSKPRTYILCPNTVYDIADSFDQDRRPRNGKQSPLVLGRSHIYIKCGSTGSSDNKCVFKGGHFQVHMSPLLLTEQPPRNEEGHAPGATANRPNNQDNRPIQNAVLQGITFTEADTFNILAEYPGELTVLDCVFENNKAISLIFGHILDKDRTDQSLRRHLHTKQSFQAEWEQQRLRRHQHRRLQTSATTSMLDIRVMECLFENNAIWAYSGVAVEGLVSAQDGAAIEITRSIFLNNHLESYINMGYFIGVSDGNLVLRDNCFIGNDDHIVPVAVDNTDFQAESNFVQRASATATPTSCDFASIITQGRMYTTNIDGLETNYTCFESDAPFCPATSVLDKVQDRIPCMDSLAFVKEVETRVQHDAWTRTYILCPDTVFSIDDYQGLYLTRSNVRIYCGINGERERNCDWQGGTVQLSIGKNIGSHHGPLVKNIVVSGVTFTNASDINVHAMSSTRVILEDCIFRNNQNLASVFVGEKDSGKTYNGAELDKPSGEDRIPENLKDEEIIDEDTTRQYQPRMTVSNCVFSENTVGSIHGLNNGVITNKNAELRVLASRFIGTTNKAILNDVGYVIGNYEGSLELKGNCFENNQVSASAILSESGLHLSFEDNYGLNSNSAHSYECDLAVMIPDLTDPDQQTEFGCAQFNGTSCDSLEDLILPNDSSMDSPFWEISTGQHGVSAAACGWFSASFLPMIMGLLIFNII